MRRKRNLNQRILDAKNYLVAYESKLMNSKEYIKDKEYIEFDKVFNNLNPIELDLGCGLGSFLIEKAKLNPNINYIGVERFANVIIGAVEKAQLENLPNLKFIKSRVECIEKFIPDGTIDIIYLNFSNPLPNSTCIKQRLTYKRYLEIYKKILNKNGHIEQKTDNEEFFKYSLESFKNNGFRLDKISYDLELENDKNNIKTEHELKYIKDGRKIYRVYAYKI